MIDPIITVFETKTDVQNPLHRKLSVIIDKFKTDVKLQERIEKLRSLESEEEYKEQKGNLPVVCFGGQFETRSNKGLLKSSGLMILDFDSKDLTDYVKFKNRLKNDNYIFCFFDSPSGQGFKALVKIPTVQNDAEYKKYYFSFMERYKELDTSGKDISRACFFSFDSEILLNHNAKVWDKKHEEEDPIKFNQSKKVYSDYKLLSRICNIIRNAVKGERNVKIYNASMLAGGYIASGALEYDVTLRALEQEADKCAPDEMRQNPKTILNGIKNGMEKPLEELKDIEKEESIEERLGKIYYTILDVQDEILELRQNGLQKGELVGFAELNPLYSVKLGSTSYVYGAPYSGKSQLWFEFLIKLSEQYKWRHAIFTPETGRPAEVYAELIQMKAQQDFYNDFDNQMDDKTFEICKDWVHRYFVVIDSGDEMMTIPDFYDVVDIVERVYNCKVHTTTIDPFNDFKHDFKNYNNRQDMYIESMLTYIRQNARSNERHNCVITHVQDQQVIHDKQNNIRYYPPATFREIAGGQAWSRKGMAMISVWRPPKGFQDENGIPTEENESWIIVQKAKPKGIGKTGTAKLYYNAKTHRYYDREFEY